jgi:hypothetical protein
VIACRGVGYSLWRRGHGTLILVVILFSPHPDWLLCILVVQGVMHAQSFSLVIFSMGASVVILHSWRLVARLCNSLLSVACVVSSGALLLFCQE